MQNLFTKCQCQKLENRCANPYLVKQIVSAHVIKLMLSEDIYVHPMFYVNLLESATINPPHASHIQFFPLLVKVDSETK